MREKAAAIFDEAKKLWSRLSGRDPKLGALDRQARNLEAEAAASFEVVHAIAQQHSSLSEHHLELAQAVDELIAANRRLTWTCAALGVIAIAALVIAIAR